MPHRLFSAAVLVVVLFALPGVAQAQGNARVIRSLTDEVKLADGKTAQWQFTNTYDPVSGEYVRTVLDENGQVVERTVTTSSLLSPNADEIAQAELLIKTDPELAGLMAQVERPLVSGGFVLSREEGHPCGPGSRCLQFDVVSVQEDGRRVERVRYVIVDARNWQVLFRDFNPVTEGNNANPSSDRSF